jgi:hypothetical protein
MASSGGSSGVPSGFQNAPAAITASASPYTYQNTNEYSEDLAIAIGTVTAIEFSRNGTTWFPTGVVAGVVRLSPGDRAKITYTVAPTLTRIPR